MTIFFLKFVRPATRPAARNRVSPQPAFFCPHPAFFCPQPAFFCPQPAFFCPKPATRKIVKLSLNDQMATSFNGPSPTLKALNNKLFVDRIIQWILRPVYTCNFCCDFLLLMDANEWMSFECSDEGTHLLVHIHQKQIKIALEIETKFVSVNH